MSDADCTPGREPRSVAASFVCDEKVSYSFVPDPPGRRSDDAGERVLVGVKDG